MFCQGSFSLSRRAVLCRVNVCTCVPTEYVQMHIKFQIVRDELNASVEAVTTVIVFCFNYICLPL